MKKATSALPGILSKQGALLLNARLVEQVADLMHDTAFFIKDASGRYVVVNQSLVDRHGLKDKSQMIGDALDVFLAGFARVHGASVELTPARVKAIG